MVIEEELKEHLLVFTRFVFQYFYKEKDTWDRFLNCFAEIDCLCSLAYLSLNNKSVMCRPKLFPITKHGRVFMDLKQMRHPSLCKLGIDFIPNDIRLG